MTSRRSAGVRHGTSLPVFYNPAQSVSSNPSFSPSAGKPALLIEHIKDDARVELVKDFPPVSRETLCLVHDPGHVEDVLSLRKENGFGNRSPEVAASLLWTNGSFLAAARHAARRGGPAFSPTSGFHHAGYAACMGFCTFNGLVLAARVLADEGLAARIGILDIDAHFGNGTDEIVRRLRMDNVVHFTFGAEAVDDPPGFVRALPRILSDRFADVDVILYQAGADPHENDPLGGFLTTDQLRLRDEIVFRFASSRRIPIVWNLAGGYQHPIEKVLDVHLNTLEACVNAFFHRTRDVHQAGGVSRSGAVLRRP